MPATLVPIRPEGQEGTRPVEEASAFSERRRQAFDELREEVNNTPNSERRSDGIEWAFRRFEKIAQKETRYWERRVRAAERVLRNMLASDALTDDQRRQIIATVYGEATTRRDEKILSAREARLIQQLRGTDSAGRQILYTLVDRLFTSSTGVALHDARPVASADDEEAGR